MFALTTLFLEAVEVEVEVEVEVAVEGWNSEVRGLFSIVSMSSKDISRTGSDGLL